MAFDDNKLTGLELEVARLRADFNLFRQDVKKNEYSNLITFIKKVLFRNTSVKILRSGIEYNLVPTYVELAAGASSSLDGSTWTDWDISAVCPVGALRADIAFQNRIDTEYLSGVRENGSSQDRFIYIGNNSELIMTVNLDSDRIVERYSTNTNVTFTVRGYWI